MKKFILTLAMASLPFTAHSMELGPFGGKEDVAYAKELWDVMVKDRMVGPDMIHSFPYEGVEPHGAVLETLYTNATVNGHKGRLVVKRNYGPEGVDFEEALNNPDKHLGAVTIMFKREAGYDDDNQNWYWAKYLKDGTLDKNPKGVELAGRVAKGADAGCIACHSGEDDYLFTINLK